MTCHVGCWVVIALLLIVSNILPVSSTNLFQNKRKKRQQRELKSISGAEGDEAESGSDETDVFEVPDFDCDVEKSRAVRDLIKDDIYQVLSVEGYTLPDSCPIALENEKLGALEQFKLPRKRGRFKCGICKKTFADESAINYHLLNKHIDRIGQLEGNMCFADYCEILRCSTGESKLFRSVLCNQKKMDKLRISCNSLIHQCFPPDQSDSAHTLNGLFRRTYCNALTCTPREDSFAELNQNSKWNAWRIFWVTIGALLTACLITFYIIYWAVQDEKTMKSDLSHLGKSRRRSRLQRFWRSRTKVKGY